MNTVLVWVLITFSSGNIMYSPPVAEYASCRKMQDSANEMILYRGTKRSECVQVTIVK